MFRRSLLRQAHQFSTRNLAVALQKPVVPLSAVRQRLSIPTYSGFQRLYSDAAATDAKVEDNKSGDAQPEKETKVNEELEKVMKELETKTKEAKDYKVCGDYYHHHRLC
jgi:hypothetical protein